MQSNYFRTETGIMRKQHCYGTPGKKARPGKSGYAVRSGIADFLKSYPIFSLNEFGEPVISGRRIC
jgi:hypothetical protein